MIWEVHEVGQENTDMDKQRVEFNNPVPLSHVFIARDESDS